MRRFVMHTILAALTLAMILGMLFVLMPAGRIGDVYPRVTTPRQLSLVIGTSRAAQAVNPAIIGRELSGLNEAPLYNFAFHLDASAYNDVYAGAIMRKLAAPDGRRALFILAVDPWALRRLDSVPDELRLRSVSSRPNWQYLARQFSRLWFSPLPTHSFVNADGRTEVDYEPRSEAEWWQRVKARMKAYEQMAAGYAYGRREQEVLCSLVRRLKRRGDVVLVRIPTSAPMLALERKCCPDFNAHMRRVAGECGVTYADFTTMPFATTDGNHLTRREGDRFSAMLGRRIREIIERRKTARRSRAVKQGRTIRETFPDPAEKTLIE